MRSALSKYFFFPEGGASNDRRAELNHLPVTKMSDALVRTFRALRKNQRPSKLSSLIGIDLLIRL